MVGMATLNGSPLYASRNIMGNVCSEYCGSSQ